MLQSKDVSKQCQSNLLTAVEAIGRNVSKGYLRSCSDQFTDQIEDSTTKQAYNVNILLDSSQTTLQMCHVDEVDPCYEGGKSGCFVAPIGVTMIMVPSPS